MWSISHTYLHTQTRILWKHSRLFPMQSESESVQKVWRSRQEWEREKNKTQMKFIVQRIVQPKIRVSYHSLSGMFILLFALQILNHWNFNRHVRIFGTFLLILACRYAPRLPSSQIQYLLHTPAETPWVIWTTPQFPFSFSPSSTQLSSVRAKTSKN